MRKRRTFTAEFKREAVRQLEAGDVTPSELARELGIPRNKLYRWKDELADKGSTAFPHGQTKSKASDLEAENARLKKELETAKEDLDILKKAAAFFAKELK